MAGSRFADRSPPNVVGKDFGFGRDRVCATASETRIGIHKTDLISSREERERQRELEAEL